MYTLHVHTAFKHLSSHLCIINSSFLLTANKPVDAALISTLRNKIIPALHIGLAQGLDSDTTVTGSCSFRTGTVGADGAPIAVGVNIFSSNIFLPNVFAFISPCLGNWSSITLPLLFPQYQNLKIFLIPWNYLFYFPFSPWSIFFHFFLTHFFYYFFILLSLFSSYEYILLLFSFPLILALFIICRLWYV